MINYGVIWVFWLAIVILFILVYFGYFVLIFILSKIKEKPIQRVNDFLPFISILIPCYNAEKVIEAKINDTLNINYPREKSEIVVVESGSDDNTYTILSKYHQKGIIKLVKQLNREGKSSAINLALPECNGAIIVLTDVDAKLAHDSVNELVKNFADHNVGAVVGNLTITPNKSLFGRMNHVYFQIFRQRVREWESKIDSSSFFSGELCAFRKSIIRKIDDNIINDDRYILLKTRNMGFRSICEPAAHVYEATPRDLNAQIIQKRRTTTGAFQGTVRFKQMFFNTKFGYFGMLILPAYFFRLLAFPFILLLLEILSPLLLFFWVPVFGVALGFGIIVLSLICFFENGRRILLSLFYGFVIQIAIFAGIFDYISHRWNVLWPKVHKEWDVTVD